MGGRAKPVSLPNGRSWPKKGDAIEHFKLMLARYKDNARVTIAADHEDLQSLLEVYDSDLQGGEPSKAG